MTDMRPSLKLIRVLAGEGHFYFYRLLRERRLFLFAKCLLNTLACFRGRGSETQARTVVFVKGSNQSRYFQHACAQLTHELGNLQLYQSALPLSHVHAQLLPRFQTRAVIQQAGFLLLMLITGRRRYLNLYLIRFAQAVQSSIDKGLPSVETFLCFNDQPYDVAAIVFALNQRKNCRTIAIQHGLVLSPNFYFPAVAREFWAWGELSRQYYRAWDKDAQLIVKGRYQDDATNKAIEFVWPPADRPVRILVAPSFFHDEVKTILTELNRAMGAECKATAQVAIKFHPATKMLWQLRWWCRQHAAWLTEEREPMERLAAKYDVLVTKNSTSAVDFLLRGKPVLTNETEELFPSLQYAFLISQTEDLKKNQEKTIGEKNSKRIEFLQSAINTKENQLASRSEIC